MTPKEKAFELYFKFYRDIIADNERAKQCALIAVDEIIENDKKNYGTDGFVVNYWEEVKQEIEIL
jgi:hypothetical protein